MIFSIGTIIPVISLLATIYFCRFFKKAIGTRDTLKAVGKTLDVNTSDSEKPAVVLNGTARTNRDWNSSGEQSPTKDWTELQDMPSPQSGKRQAYQRAGSKDSMEVR